MAAEKLTGDQLAFLEKCALEFSNRFTDSDIEFKKVYEEVLPSPPVMSPWGRPKLVAHRNRGHGSRHEHQYNRYDNNRGPRDDRRDNYNNHRYSPY